jgi:hypothetical protein
MGALRATQPSRPWPGVAASRAFKASSADWCAGRRRAKDAEWGSQVRVCGDLRYQSQTGTLGRGGLIGSEADWSGGVMQYGGVVMMFGGSIEFKGGSIARSSAVREPRC